MKAITCIFLLPCILLLSCEMKVNTTSNQEQPEQTEANEKNVNISFPVETGYDDEYLTANFWKCNYNQAGDSLAYWVILPNDVKTVRVEPTPIEGSNLLNIGRYEGKSPYLEIWVVTERIANYIEPANWLRNVLDLSGESILHEEELVGQRGVKYLDVLTLKNFSVLDQSISRFTVYRDGNDYYFIKVSCSMSDYESLAKTIRHISSNWGLGD